MNIMSSSTRTSTFCLLLPQNGVYGRPSKYDFDSEVSPPKRDRSRSRSRDRSSPMELSFKMNDGPHRPSMLAIGGTPGLAAASSSSLSKPRAVNRVRDDSEEVEDGSLPCTPDAQCDVDMEDGHTAAGEGALASDTRQYIGTFLADCVSSVKIKGKRDKVHTTMRRVVESVLEKHQYAYNGMIKKLGLEGRGDDMTFVTSVAASLFADGTTNWGRIASLVAFGAAVSHYLKAMGREHCVTLVAQEISSYLLSDQREWLVKNNSWDGFVEFFQVADPETTVRNTLMAFAGVAGLGATIALLIR
ncbi:hypothetical protein CRUP_033972 [Coryphaenoides rupestris]|nr:hypothetical protein CRUP_033972 [Coryphaenoides rupestris]